MKRINALGLIILLIVSVLMTACSDANGSDGKTVVIGTAGSSGTFYAVGAGMTQILNKYSSFESVSQGTNGATENVRLLNSGNIDVGFGNWDALYFGYEGTGPFDGEKQNINSLMSLYLSGGQMIVKESSSIQSYADLKGKKINLGPPGSTITEMSKIILEEYGVDPETDINAFYLDFGEGGSKLKDGDLDATFYVAGIPTAGVIDLSSSTKIRMLNLDEEIGDTIIEKYPYYEKLTVPANTYKGIDYDVQTLQLWTALMVSEDMSEDMAYEIVKTLIENVDEFKEVHSVGVDFSLENAVKAPIPIHPGAQKYFEEQGVLK